MTRSLLGKRVFDLVLATAGLIVLSPVLAAVSYRVWREHDGPILYRGVRAGRAGRPFIIYKFRTMVPNAERIGGPSTADNDPRLTRVGLTLRRYKLDELPQLFNIVRGDMSIDGPRPQVLEEVSGYSDEERLLLEVRPGITHWASIRFHNEGDLLRGHPDADKAYAELIRPEKMRLSLEYVRSGTLKDDIRIVVATALVPLRSRKVKHSL